MTTDQEKAHNIEKNKKRIAKMKEMYKMFLKMEKGEDAAQEDDDEEPASEKNAVTAMHQHSKKDVINQAADPAF